MSGANESEEDKSERETTTNTTNTTKTTKKTIPNTKKKTKTETKANHMKERRHGATKSSLCQSRASTAPDFLLCCLF